MNNLVIIHVGKCGGSTVCDELRSKNVKFSTIHVREAIYEPNKNYVIVIRNPIKRFISAFNWRYYLVCDSKIQKNKNEEKFLNKYKNVDNLCNAIEINSDIMNESTHHIVMDIYFYLKTFIKKCPKKQILGVICTETLKDDMKNIFDIDVIKHAKNNSKYNKIITDKSYEILKTYLKNDYIIIDQMYKCGWISDKQYKILKS
tara:strand:- start:4240 stop:4845 length:606 start_codon:yes stop_codon:yes gene_type:complete